MPSQAKTLSRKLKGAASAAQENLNSAYQQFMKEQEPAQRDESGKSLIRAIFGRDAIAEV